jgi:hypothetical protein
MPLQTARLTLELPSGYLSASACAECASAEITVKINIALDFAANIDTSINFARAPLDAVPQPNVDSDGATIARAGIAAHKPNVYKIARAALDSAAQLQKDYNLGATIAIVLPKNARSLMRPINFTRFLKLNWTCKERPIVKVPLSLEEYKKPATRTNAASYKNYRADFPDCEIHQLPDSCTEERNLVLERLWQDFRSLNLKWADERGRVNNWPEFNKRNAKYLRSKSLTRSPSAIWEQYQWTWLYLIGLH